MQRTGRIAKNANNPSKKRNSAGLNFIESHRGHVRIHNGCGSQSGQLVFE